MLSSMLTAVRDTFLLLTYVRAGHRLRRCPCQACCYCDAACQRKDWARHKRAHRDLLLQQQQQQMQQRMHLQQQQHDAPSAVGRASAGEH